MPTEIHETTVYALSKSQQIRLIDVFLIAPFMWHFASKAKSVSPTEKNLMKFLAIATLYYNGKNYLTNKNKRGRLAP